MIVQAQSLTKTFPLPRARLFQPRDALAAVDGVDLTIARGEAVGLIGESGSGKSTLARMIMGFETPNAGRICFDGQDLQGLSQNEFRALRARFQMVFQDPYSSLNPRRNVGWSIGEPLRRQGHTQCDRAVFEALEQVGLRATDAAKFPHEFSGGQRQRIAIARAIISRPDLIVADEAVSALDMSVQAQILNLLMDLQDELGLAMLFISHDLAVVAAICDRITVMRHGVVVESGSTQRIMSDPADPYTRTLLSASGLS